MTRKLTALALALGLTSTAAMANTGNFNFEGNSDVLASGCSFIQLQDGAMTWNEETGIWTVSDQGGVKIKMRSVLSVTVDNDGSLRDAVGVVDTLDAVDYTGSTVTDVNDRYDPVVTVADTISVTDVGAVNILTMGVGGTLDTSDDFVAESETNYYLQNVVTCTQ